MKNDPEKFIYWLQGFFELANPRVLDDIQVKIIKDRLALCFDKVTPAPSVKFTGFPIDTKTSWVSGYDDPNLYMFDDPGTISLSSQKIRSDWNGPFQ